MNNPHAHIRSLPPEGAAASLGAARREKSMNNPHAHFRSLPPEGAAASLGAARREAA
jgi:hypothetical protein